MNKRLWINQVSIHVAHSQLLIFLSFEGLSPTQYWWNHCPQRSQVTQWMCTTAPVSNSTTNGADCQGMPLTENQNSSSQKQSQRATKSHICMHVRHNSTATLTHNHCLAVAINHSEEVEETAMVCNKDTSEQEKKCKSGRKGFGTVWVEEGRLILFLFQYIDAGTVSRSISQLIHETKKIQFEISDHVLYQFRLLNWQVFIKH